MIFQAHRGVSSEYPENTMPAYIAAVEQGYKLIELDVAVTSDLKLVLIHDRTINRTARDKNGEAVKEITRVCDITYDQARQYDYGRWLSESFCGTEIPLLEDVLEFARKSGVKLKIDNCYRAFSEVQKQALFELLYKYQDIACLTCFTVEELQEAARRFDKMEFHYDGIVTPENLEILGGILPKERLNVWLAHKNEDTTWVQVEFASKALADLVKKYARLGVWILSTEEHLKDAEELGADIIETNGKLKPGKM